MEKICQLCSCDVTDSMIYTEDELNRIVDGKTKQGSWAWMCVPCHRENGGSLGMGRGQLYDTLTGTKLEG